MLESFRTCEAQQRATLPIPKNRWWPVQDAVFCASRFVTSDDPNDWNLTEHYRDTILGQPATVQLVCLPVLVVAEPRATVHPSHRPR